MRLATQTNGLISSLKLKFSALPLRPLRLRVEPVSFEPKPIPPPGEVHSHKHLFILGSGYAGLGSGLPLAHHHV